MDFENVVLAMVLEVLILKNKYFPNDILILILKMLPWLRFWRYLFLKCCPGYGSGGVDYDKPQFS